MTVSNSENKTESRSSIRIRFTTFWTSEIHSNLKIDADALHRRRRRFSGRRTTYNIDQGQ
jgi:hypothetical protein